MDTGESGAHEFLCTTRQYVEAILIGLFSPDNIALVTIDELPRDEVPGVMSQVFENMTLGERFD